MATTLSSTVHSLNRIKHRARVANTALRLARAVTLAAVAVSLWSLVRPQDQLGQLALGGVAFVIAALAALGKTAPEITAGDLALALEMRCGGWTRAPLPPPDAALPPDWAPLLADEVAGLKSFESRRTMALASTLVLPLAICLVTLPSAAPSFKLALNEVSNAVARLGRGATLKVIQGAATDLGEKALDLDPRRPLELELLAQNLVEVDVSGSFGKTPPAVELRRPGGPGIFQSFQMLPRRGDTDDEARRHEISFAVSEPVDLYIPALDASRPLAHVKVHQLPIPKVTLSQTADTQDPWPDDQPLPLHIEVRAENPLQAVRLLIKSGQRTSSELVANVVADDKHELQTDYRLLLEQYVENDLAEVEIVAEAVDRAVPQPLVGVSPPLRLNTASAYGRYRQSLETLRGLKSLVDQAVTKGEAKLPPDARVLAAKAAEQSEKSPFFDGLDRVQIHRFDQKVGEQAAAPRLDRLMELSQNLDDFLFEHEILDDRERDRDFFVAVRAQSRLVEQEASKRPVPLANVTERMKRFLDDRQQRWAKRIDRLPPAYRPARWAEIRDQRPFHRTMDQVQKLDQAARTGPEARSEQLTLLSKAVVDYRAWIEELEAKEDKAREEQDRQRQEGLASARDQLRELQKRQAEVSAAIDRSDQRTKADLDSIWPTAHMKQNTNAKETHRLEAQVRTMAPQAGERIEAAAKAMDSSNELGQSGNYVDAETNADLAGRLLRQAESAAQQQQQQRRSRGRRRRVTGDNYYGQSVVGGDVEIKREYQVDRRYREDILDEVQSSSYDDDNRALLENYLRHVVR